MAEVKNHYNIGTDNVIKEQKINDENLDVKQDVINKNPIDSNKKIDYSNKHKQNYSNKTKKRHFSGSKTIYHFLCTGLFLLLSLACPIFIIPAIAHLSAVVYKGNRDKIFEKLGFKGKTLKALRYAANVLSFGTTKGSDIYDRIKKHKNTDSGSLKNNGCPSDKTKQDKTKQDKPRDEQYENNIPIGQNEGEHAKDLKKRREKNNENKQISADI